MFFLIGFFIFGRVFVSGLISSSKSLKPIEKEGSSSLKSSSPSSKDCRLFLLVDNRGLFGGFPARRFLKFLER